jgi:hypothetical protein
MKIAIKVNTVEEGKYALAEMSKLARKKPCGGLAGQLNNGSLLYDHVAYSSDTPTIFGYNGQYTIKGEYKVYQFSETKTAFEKLKKHVGAGKRINISDNRIATITKSKITLTDSRGGDIGEIPKSLLRKIATRFKLQDTTSGFVVNVTNFSVGCQRFTNIDLEEVLANIGD